ncbi:MAG: HI0074 family nucleotidyltransferase substrate-binding subunit [Muricoprocola sp.]
MENKYINRYHTFCKSLKNLEKSKYADPKEDFVLEGTVLNFNLTFDIAWKVMKDILVKQMGVLDFATGSPRETLQQAFVNRIIDNDQWIQMLRVRNQLAHDYDGSFAMEKFKDIVNIYYPLFENFKNKASEYYESEHGDIDKSEIEK